MPLPRVAILTLSWNARETTLRWLTRLERLDYPRSCVEIVIHDNASRDGSQAALREAVERMQGDGWGGLVLVEAPEHPGVTAAFNEALARVSSAAEYILRLDNDVDPRPDLTRVLVETMEARRDAGIVGCQVIHQDPRLPHYGAIFVDWLGGANRIVEADAIIGCDVVLGCAFMTRRALVERIGFLFDPTLFFFQEESDLCLRARRLGWRVLYNPAAVVVHDAGTSSGRHPQLTRYLAIRNGVVVMRRYNRFPRKLVAYGRTALFAAKELLTRGDGLPARALVDGWSGRPLSRGWWVEEMARAGGEREVPMTAQTTARRNRHV